MWEAHAVFARPNYLGGQTDTEYVCTLLAMNARCPECGGGLGELLTKYATDDGVIADFRCSDCDHEWPKPL